jgi:hypothetical protein
MCTLGAISGKYLFKTRDLWSESDTAEEIINGHGRYRYVGVRGHASPLEKGLNSGVNEKGVAVAITFVDTVPLAEALLHKIPRGVLVEKILSNCDDIASALQVITDFMPKQLVGGNIVVATPEGSLVLEQLYPRFAIEYVTKGISVRTNHFLNLVPDGEIIGNQDNSHERLLRMKSLLEKGRPTSLESIQASLTDHKNQHQICSHSGELRTVSAVVYDLNSAELHYAAGPPCSTNWKIYAAG